MVWIHKLHFVVATDAGETPRSAGTPGPVAGQHDVLPVPAAWPAAVSQLAQAIDACQRDSACLLRASRTG
jgi:hypothetical protein